MIEAKFYYNPSLNWYARTYEGDADYILVYKKDNSPARTLLSLSDALKTGKWYVDSPSSVEYLSGVKSVYYVDVPFTKEATPARSFNSVEDAELWAWVENNIDEIKKRLNTLEVNLKDLSLKYPNDQDLGRVIRKLM